MKKILSLCMATSLILLLSLAVIPANAGIGSSSYRVFYTHESVVGDKNADMDTLDTLIAYYTNTGSITYIGEGVEPEIAGSYVMWHSSDYTKTYAFKIGVTPVFQSIWFRDYGTDYEIHKDGIAFNSLESQLDQDVNLDGDKTDKVVGYYDLHQWTTINTYFWTGEKVQRGGYDGDTIIYVKYESQETLLYNQDGDYTDSLIFYRQIVSYQPGTELYASHPTVGDPASCPPAGSNDYVQGTYPRIGEDGVWTTYESYDDCDWNGDSDKNDYIVVGFELTGASTSKIDETQYTYEATHYVHKSLVAYAKTASDQNLGPQTMWYSINGVSGGAAFLGSPIKVTADYIEGYLKESDVGVDMNGDSDTGDEAMWIFDKTSKATEILEGGNTYWK
jgi:hypothetical protein